MGDRDPNTEQILREATEALDLFEERIDELDAYFEQLHRQVKRTLRRQDGWRWFPHGRSP